MTGHARWSLRLPITLLVVFACIVGLVAPGPAAARELPATLPVRQASPDLTVAKTNNVTGLTTVGSTWAWTFAIRNGGAASATFTAGQTVLLDNLPSPNVSYTSVTPAAVGGSTGALACAVDPPSNLTCVASGGNVVIPVGSGFDVVLQATSSVPALYADPRAGGVCRVDPSAVVAEINESNNDCADSVRVVGADLTVTKTNNVAGSATVGVPWIWTITIRNDGIIPANFLVGQRLLLDALPNTGVVYTAPTVTPINGAAASVACAIDGQSNLSCQIVGADLILAANTGYTVAFQGTAAAPGVYANPRAGGVCAVDPDGVVAENSEANNACPDTVTVPGPDLTATKTNNAGGAVLPNAPWVWRIVIANGAGALPATFAANQRVLLDNLPNSGVTYGAPVVTLAGGATGTVTCAIDGTFALVCVAATAVTIPPGGSFEIAFAAASTAPGSYANPRAGGVCLVDPDGAVLETNDANNACTDTVTVGLPTTPTPAAANDPNNDDEDDRPLTETQRHQRARTNASGLDDYRTEGNVLEVRCDASAPPAYEVSFPTHTPYLVIATRDGNQQLRLTKRDAREQCPSVRVGDYAEADGDKEHELLFNAHNLTVKRRR